MQVLGLGIGPDRVPLLLIQEREGAHRVLPVSIGLPEAVAIEFGLCGLRTSRPQTHELINNVVRTLGSRIEHVDVTALSGNIFHAELVLDGEVRISARVSDAVALALLTGTTIRATDEVLDAAGADAVQLGLDPTATEIAEFRARLDRATPEDFRDD